MTGTDDCGGLEKNREGKNVKKLYLFLFFFSFINNLYISFKNCLVIYLYSLFRVNLFLFASGPGAVTWTITRCL